MCGHYQMCNLGNGAGMLGYGVALGAHGAGMLMGWRGLEKGVEGGGRYIYVFPPVDIYMYIYLGGASRGPGCPPERRLKPDCNKKGSRADIR